jgi:ComF family protein
MAALGTSMAGGMAAGLRRAVRPLAPAGRLLLDAVLPPHCLACGATVAAPGALCAACWPALSFLTPPWCACCGYPFEYDAGPDALCAGCIASPPPWRRARAALRYDEASRGLILAFKHGDRTEMAPALVRWLAGAADLSEIDLVAAVPLHWRRLFARRYNQAALLALGLARLSGKPAIPDLLRRRRATASQGHLGALARERNVAGAFAVNPARRGALAGARVLLVDDVVTTGATVAACCRVLRREGAAAVDVLAVARVVRPAR